MAKLFNAQTGAGTVTGTAYQLQSYGIRPNTYPYTVKCYGTFNGATVILQASDDQSTWFDVYSFTAQDAILAEFDFKYVRGKYTSGGASTSITLEI